MFQLSEAAARDIESIFESSKIDFGIIQTEKYFKDLKKCFELLNSNPQIGSKALDLKSGYYRFPHRSHIIFYRIRKEGIFIVRVLHERMDITKRIEE